MSSVSFSLCRFSQEKNDLENGSTVCAPFILHCETAEDPQRKENEGAQKSQAGIAVFQHTNPTNRATSHNDDLRGWEEDRFCDNDVASRGSIVRWCGIGVGRLPPSWRGRRWG